MSTPLTPSATLLVKLGSLITHYQERNSKTGHYVDEVVISALERDKEVIGWLYDMEKLALLPVKR